MNAPESPQIRSTGQSDSSDTLFRSADKQSEQRHEVGALGRPGNVHINVKVNGSSPHVVNEGSRSSVATHENRQGDSTGPAKKPGDTDDGTEGRGTNVNAGGGPINANSAGRNGGICRRIFWSTLVLVLIGVPVYFWFEEGLSKHLETPQLNKAYQRIFEDIRAKQSECLKSATCTDTNINNRLLPGPSDTTLQKMAVIPMVLLQIEDNCNSSETFLRQFEKDLLASSHFFNRLTKCIKTCRTSRTVAEEFPIKVGMFIDECGKSADRTISIIEKLANKPMIDKNELGKAMRIELDANLQMVEQQLRELLRPLPMQCREYYRVDSYLSNVLLAGQAHSKASDRWFKGIFQGPHAWWSRSRRQQNELSIVMDDLSSRLNQTRMNITSGLSKPVLSYFDSAIRICTTINATRKT